MTISLKGTHGHPPYATVWHHEDGYLIQVSGQTILIDQDEADRLAHYLDSRYESVDEPNTPQIATG